MSDFSRLVQQHHALVFRVARSLLRDDAAAEDATQDVYLKLLRQPDALAAVQNPRAYLCRAASRRALEILREGARRARREEAAVMTHRDPGPEEAAFRRELRGQVDRLPEDQRAAVSLHYFAGLSLAETAAALEIPQGTVASRVSAGLDRLRKVLAAAAAPAVLAMLEGELSACEAGRPVPSGVEERLLRLEAVPAPASPSRSRRIAAGAAAVVAVLVGLAFLRERATGPRDDDRPALSLVPATPSAAPQADPPVAAASETPDPDEDGGSVTMRFGATGYGWSGFLCRTGQGLVLRAPRYDASPTRDDFAVGEDIASLATAAATEDASFVNFLDGGPVDSAPATWVEISVSETRVDDGESRRTITVKRIEPLNPVWLEAWRDLVAAGAELDLLWLETPGAERAASLEAAATRLAEARRRALSARRGESETGWRRMAEARVFASHADRLERAGLAAPLGERPTPARLYAAFQAARSGAELKAQLLADFGDDVLAARIAWYWQVQENDGTSRVSPGVQEVRWLFVDSDAAFEAKRLEQAELQRRCEAQPAAPAPRVACGLTLAPLSAAERAALALDGGARVAEVGAGSAAEAAGFRAGDILWRDGNHEVPAAAEDWARRLTKAEGDLELDVVRDGVVVRVTLGR